MESVDLKKNGTYLRKGMRTNIADEIVRTILYVNFRQNMISSMIVRDYYQNRVTIAQMKPYKRPIHLGD